MAYTITARLGGFFVCFLVFVFCCCFLRDQPFKILGQNCEDYIFNVRDSLHIQCQGNLKNLVKLGFGPKCNVYATKFLIYSIFIVNILICNALQIHAINLF